MIINGELQNGLGGGICQVSTTVFNAAFEAGLPITARTNHALYISHYPLGRDATVNYPDLDLRFSTTPITGCCCGRSSAPGSLTVNLYGQRSIAAGREHHRAARRDGPRAGEGDRGSECSRRGRGSTDEFGAPPRETSVHRLVYDANGKLLYDNTWRSFYVGEPSLVRVGTKEPPKKKPVKKKVGEAPTVTTPAAGDDDAGATTPARTTPATTTPATTTPGPTVTTPARP